MAQRLTTGAAQRGYGYFEIPASERAGAQLLSCVGLPDCHECQGINAVTHTGPEDKGAVTVTWNAPGFMMRADGDDVDDDDAEQGRTKDDFQKKSLLTVLFV